MNYSPPGSAEIDAIKSDGTVVESVDAVGCTLVANTTYYFPFGDPDAPTPTETPLADFQLKWDRAIALVATVETCSFPKFKRNVKAGPDAVVDVSDFDTTAGNCSVFEARATLDRALAR